MLSLHCTAIGFITKNEEYNPEENIRNGRYLKNLILRKVCLAIENNHLKCGDYLLLFLMRTDDDKQHFN